MVHEEEASLSYTLVTRGHHCNGWPYFLIWLSSWTQTTKLWLNKQICYPLHYGATDFMQKQSKNVCVCVCICIFSLTTFSWIWQLETEILIEISSVNERHK